MMRNAETLGVLRSRDCIGITELLSLPFYVMYRSEEEAADIDLSDF